MSQICLGQNGKQAALRRVVGMPGFCMKTGSALLNQKSKADVSSISDSVPLSWIMMQAACFDKDKIRGALA